MKIAIIGAGYVGLPLATAFAKYYPVVCYDINKSRIQNLQKGIDSNKQHFKKEILQKKLIDLVLLQSISAKSSAIFNFHPGISSKESKHYEEIIKHFSKRLSSFRTLAEIHSN